MALRKMILDPDDFLRKKSRIVDVFDKRLWTLLDDMNETMQQQEGMGLAAVQVGVLKRIVVINTGESGLLELINPKITETEGHQVGREGCLSFPGMMGIVARPHKVTVSAQDRKGKLFSVTGEGLLARAFCHELDHLDGKLFVDTAEKIGTVEEFQKQKS